MPEQSTGPSVLGEDQGRELWTPVLTEEQGRDLFWFTFEDDTEESPWMTMGDLQFWSASSFAHSLRIYAHEQGLAWYVASMLPILFRLQTSRKRQVSPDIFVAFVPEHPRSSFDSEREGGFPPFVLEVVSPSSVERDEEDKRKAYEDLEVREYALFTPREEPESSLRGYRRNSAGRFEPWEPDSSGRLWSEVLGLYLIVQDDLLQAQTLTGRLLLTPEQEADARRQAAVAYQREAEARQRAETEVERLRRELEQYRNGHDEHS